MSDDNLLCDFCSALSPAWTYQSLSFIVYLPPAFAGGSVGGWAACDECHALIEANKREELTQRCLDEFTFKHPEIAGDAAILHQFFAEIQDQFFKHRI